MLNIMTNICGIDYTALSGRWCADDHKPRALPWAVLVWPFRPKKSEPMRLIVIDNELYQFEICLSDEN